MYSALKSGTQDQDTIDEFIDAGRKQCSSETLVRFSKGPAAYACSIITRDADKGMGPQGFDPGPTNSPMAPQSLSSLLL